MRALIPLICSLLVLGGCTDTTEPRKGGSEILVSWNERSLSIAEAEDGFLTLKGVRTAAMMHLAIHDALNAIEPRYSSYQHASAAPTDPAGDPTAAAAQAAFEVLVTQYPDTREELALELKRWLDEVPAGDAKSTGAAKGRSAASAILDARREDGWNNEADYQWHPMGPGVYAEFQAHSGTPEGFIFGAGWATATPFALDTASHFRAPPPPSIDSDAYTRAFDEVKRVGAFESFERTEDQAHLAMWWKDFAENSSNRWARQLVLEENLDLWPAARMFALLNVSVFDAYVNVFDNKFFYNHWRPYTAIRWAANDGNDDTDPDAEWDNLHRHTYAFPSYPSAHGTACSAAMTVFAGSFGDAYPFTARTELVDRTGPMSGKVEMNPSTRSFKSFSDAAAECGLSRIYLGIHFRYDSVAGNRLGGQIGDYVLEHFLRPVAAAEDTAR